jgi:hypothetical protein
MSSDTYSVKAPAGYAKILKPLALLIPKLIDADNLPALL